MERVISIDAGKDNTKYDIDRVDGIKEYIFPTKVDEVRVEEEPEEGTYIVLLNDKAYRVGENAVNPAPKSTTKMSIHHQVAAWTAIGLTCDSGDVVNAAIGCPLAVYENVNKRNEYKDFILPKGEIEIKIKTIQGTQSKKITIGKRMIAPEGSGLIYQDSDYFKERTVAIIDLGGLNFQAAIYEKGLLQHDKWINKNYGGRVFIDKLTSDINSEFGTDFDDKLIRSKLLSSNTNERFIRVEGDTTSKERSMAFIDKKLEEYTKEIFSMCKEEVGIDPLNMEVWLTGGTALLIKDYAIRFYGNEIHIPENPERVNAKGWCGALKVACNM